MDKEFVKSLKLQNVKIDTGYTNASELYVDFTIDSFVYYLFLTLNKEKNQWEPIDINHDPSFNKYKKCPICHLNHPVCNTLSEFTNEFYEILWNHSSIRLKKLFL